MSALDRKDHRIGRRHLCRITTLGSEDTNLDCRDSGEPYSFADSISP
jgi:hypothetical protein